MGTTVVEALSAFPRWMNRPTARVQVYAYRIAKLLYGADSVSILFHALPKYRDLEAKEQRKTCRGAIRIARMGGKRVALPKYDEATGEYL